MPTKRKSYTTSSSAKRRKMRSSAAGLLSFPARRVKRMSLRKSLTSRNVHSFCRHAASTYRDLDTGVEQDGAFSFSFNDISGYSDFTNLYDRYMITGIQLRIRVINNPNAALGLNNLGSAPASGIQWNATNWFPRLFFIKDYDDTSAETVAELKERAKTKMIILKPNVYYKVFVKPSVLMQTYRTTTTTGYAPKWNNWIDMAQVDVPHYGFKYAFDTSGQDPQDNYPFRFEIEKKYYFKCKDVR